MKHRTAFVGTLFFIALTSCSDLPASGPSTSDVYNSAEPENNLLGFRIVDLSMQTIDATSNATEKQQKFHTMIEAGPVDTIGFGDVLSVSIFEAGSGLFGGGIQAGSSTESDTITASTGAGGGTSSTTLPHLVVDRDGTVTIPYAGRVNVMHLTPTEAQNRIQARLKNKAAQPQVIVDVVKNETNTIIISGDVKLPGVYPLSLVREHIMDAVALAGGPTHQARDTYVTLTRSRTNSSALLRSIESNPEEDIMLAPHDRLRLEFQPRTYSVFGATGRMSEVPFEYDQVNLVEGLARAGGLGDFQADPRGIFIFRIESPKVAHQLGIDAHSSVAPIIYHADLTQASTFFLMQRFQLKSKDVIFVSDAPVLKLQKLLNVANGFFTPALTTRQISQ